jgi:hypothetical protein
MGALLHCVKESFWQNSTQWSHPGGQGVVQTDVVRLISHSGMTLVAARSSTLS